MSISTRFRSLVVLLGLTIFAAGHGVGWSSIYPSPSEARETYDWLTPQLFEMFGEEGAGWAIDDLDAVPDSLPPGVFAEFEFTSTGWATFGIALSPGLANNTLKVGGLATQTDVKTRWPDSSIRFAVVTADIPQAGQYEISAGPGATGTLQTSIPSQTFVELNVGGTTYTAQLPSTASSDRWLDGPLVSEWRHTLTPTTSGGTPHPFLRVNLEYRAYDDGQGRFDVTVENVLNVSSAKMRSYDVEVVVAGQTRFQKNNVPHGYLTRWRKVFGVGLSEAQVIPHLEPFHRAGAFPRILGARVANQTYNITGSNYEILHRGGNSYDYMPTAGGRHEIAPYPAGAAQYIAHRTQNLRDYVLINGDLIGSWPVHIREADGSFLTIDQRPEFWLDERGSDKPAGDLNGTGPLVPDNSHQPSWAYLPYLLTGDRYYADEMAFWANFVMLFTWPEERGFEQGGSGSDGILGRNNSPRGFGWGFRNMVDAAAYLPDSHPLKEYLNEKVQNNLTWGDQFVAAWPMPPTGALTLDNFNDAGTTGVWQHSYLGFSFDHAHQQGFVGGESMLNSLAGFQSKLGTSSPEYPREYLTPFSLSIGVPNGQGECCIFFQTMGEIFDETFGNPPGDPGDYQSDWGGAARIMLMVQARDLQGGGVLSVEKIGTGSGSVTSDPTGIDCGPDCAEFFPSGTVVDLTPTPDNGSIFSGWQGNADCSDGSVTVGQNISCTAVFDSDGVSSFSLTVAKTGSGSGTVTSNPVGIDCGPDCQESYPVGTPVQLSAIPDSGSFFAGWGGDGDCSDGAVTMNQDKDCTATFSLDNGSCEGVVRIDDWSTLPDTEYLVDVAYVGQETYTDRSYSISTISPELDGQTLIQTANDDKYIEVSDHLFLTLCVPAMVYIGYDDRASVLPVWLSQSEWSQSSQSLGTSDTDMTVYERSAAAGSLILGGNIEGGETGADSNYIVLIQPAPGLIFEDGFESGDTGLWVTTP